MIDQVDQFQTHRPNLARLAYRMLGSHADVDDVLQEAYLRWSKVDQTTVRTPAAFLTSVVTRLCIDRRREIDARKETYIGPWLPDPILEPAPPADHPAEVAESVSLALLYLLERLSPAERAAYLLRRIFNYDYQEISEILETSVVNCRQLVSRAERQVAESRPRFAARHTQVDRIRNQFLHACATGDLSGMLKLLADDVVMVSDGGGKAKAALRPVFGADRVARFFLGIFRKAPAGSTTQHVLVNGEPGLAIYVDEKLATILSLDVIGERIHGFYLVRNPEKLARAMGDFRRSRS